MTRRKLVIGGGSGVGAAIVDELYRRDYDSSVVIIDKKPHPERRTFIMSFPTDHDTTSLYPHNYWDRIYITIGVPSHRSFDDADWGKKEKIVRDNYLSVLNALEVAREFATDDASYVITSSVSAQLADPFGSIYSSAKAALEALVRGLAREWVPSRVNCIAPGPTATQQFLANVPMSNQARESHRSPHHTLMSPRWVASAAVDLSEMEGVSGVVLPVDLAGVSSSRREA